MKQIVMGDFFGKNLLLKYDLVFDPKWNGRNFTFLAPPDLS